MVLRELFLISLFALLSACGSSEVEIIYQRFRSDSLHLQNANGTWVNAQKPFTGIVYILYPNTNDTASIICFQKGKEHGSWQQIYPNGQRKEQRYFENGIKVKTDSVWWENGQLQLAAMFENGEYEGELREWNKQGVLIREKHYKAGHEEGSQKQFYDNGKIRSNYIVQNGKRIGLLGTKNCVNVSDSVFAE